MDCRRWVVKWKLELKEKILQSLSTGGDGPNYSGGHKDGEKRMGS